MRRHTPPDRVSTKWGEPHRREVAISRADGFLWLSAERAISRLVTGEARSEMTNVSKMIHVSSKTNKLGQEF
jgi:hypothetical protein